jgi:hypothetical protein
MKTGRLPPLARSLNVEELPETGHDPLHVAHIEAALGDEPRFAVLRRLRVSGEQEGDRPTLFGQVCAPRHIDRCDLEDRDGRAMPEIPARGVEEAGA